MLKNTYMEYSNHLIYILALIIRPSAAEGALLTGARGEGPVANNFRQF